MPQRSSRSTSARKLSPIAAKQNSSPIAVRLDFDIAAAEPKNEISSFIAADAS